MDNTLIAQAVARRLAHATHVMVLTGAGMSQESGIPTFRDAQSGLWSQFNPTDFATPTAWRRDAALVLGWYCWRAAGVRNAQPNAGHHALARLGSAKQKVSLVTQNVDDLHERAGSPEVVHLHGRIDSTRCFACNRSGGALRIPADALDHPQLRVFPDRCAHCGGYLRPDVVWFGERLPEDAWRRADAAARKCDLMLVIGTSLLVQPAAMLPLIVQRRGACVVEINPEAEPKVLPTHIAWRATAAEALPRLASEVAA